MSHYSLAVALFDYLPVLLSALAMASLARLVRRRAPALGPYAVGAAVLIPFGGLCKASWKLIIALGGDARPWLESLLFLSLAPGFVTMACVLAIARKPSATMRDPRPLALLAIAPVVLALALMTALPGSRAAFFLLLGITTVATVTLLAHAIMAARSAGLTGVAVLFTYALVATLAMGGLARLAAGEASAWLQEGVNASIQAALAYGFWRLARATRENGR